ncbi:uncharacterized protein [Rutidosis leptorrhynchoides]|uniref:uncharacterized protein n=1 Tax=Rutidosis leptorrhynchoides TaxID=125765 RepID=UPI003A98EE1D
MEPKITPFAAITTEKPNINIRCKLLSIETFSKPNVDNGAPYLEAIVVDEKGDRICITLKNPIKKKHESMLKEQEAYIVQNIYVQNNFNMNKLNHWVHSNRLMMINKSSVLPVPSSDWSGNNGFRFIPFAYLLTCALPEKHTADVIGKVQYYDREPKSYGSNNDDKSKYINLELQDLEGSVISCTLWRDYMVTFLGHMKNVKDDECVILVIQFGRTNKFGRLTHFGKPQQRRFRSITGTFADTVSDTPTKDIDEWFANSTCVTNDDLSFESPGTYVILAEIIAIEPDMPWSYISCKKCHKTANPVSKEVDLTLDIDQQLALKRTCSGTCGDNPQIAVRFKVIVRVADEYDTATLTIFESVVNKFVTKSAYQLKKSMKEDDDQPEELDALLGNTLLFKLEITGYNKKHTTSTTHVT